MTAPSPADKPEVCCGEFPTCRRPCTPRGANEAMQRVERMLRTASVSLPPEFAKIVNDNFWALLQGHPESSIIRPELGARMHQALPLPVQPATVTTVSAPAAPAEGPTPRTDALAKQLDPHTGLWVEAEEFEQLEREVAAHEAVRDACFEALGPECHVWGDVPGHIEELKSGLAAMKQLYGAACLQLQERGDKSVALSARRLCEHGKGYNECPRCNTAFVSTSGLNPWVLVEDRLPDNGDPVVVFEGNASHMRRLAYYDNIAATGWHWCGYEGECNPDAWMPIPMFSRVQSASGARE